MVKKSLNLAVISMAATFLSACTSTPRTRPTPKSYGGHASPQLPVDTAQNPEVLPAPEVPSAEAPPVNGEAPSDVPRKAARVGVWVQGTAFDAFAALGFLQELEKQKIKPVKVVGTGFGCWIAWSWALENNGNRAEWQSFKWNHWDYVQSSSLLGRIGLDGTKKRFITEVDKHFPDEVLRKVILPVDCPLVESQAPFPLVSAKKLRIGSLMWEQFQIPALMQTASDSDDEYLSGLFAEGPTADELDAYSAGGVEAWIVLRTQSNSALASADSRESQASSYRAKLVVRNSGETAGRRPWMVLDLRDGAERPVEQLTEAPRRRAWLLGGRNKAHKLLDGDALKNFIYRSAQP